LERSNDAAVLCGIVAGKPVFSHAGREGAYDRFPLTVRRLSGAEDTVNVIAPEALLRGLEVSGQPRLRVTGEVRSFNNRSGGGPKLVITVLARELAFTDGGFENDVRLTGAVCRAPTLRRTPMGRRICDLMLAVNRRCGRSDYLPCIVWGAQAESAARFPVGTAVRIRGRLQSRAYIKCLEDGSEERVAFEISAAEIAAVQQENEAAPR